MTRHVLDSPSDRDRSARLREFVRVERESRDHPSTVGLHRRPHEARGVARLMNYLRIDRGRTQG